MQVNRERQERQASGLSLEPEKNRVQGRHWKWDHPAPPAAVLLWAPPSKLLIVNYMYIKRGEGIYVYIMDIRIFSFVVVGASWVGGSAPHPRVALY